jgi:hypothetical protein
MGEQAECRGPGRHQLWSYATDACLAHRFRETSAFAQQSSRLRHEDQTVLYGDTKETD